MRGVGSSIDILVLYDAFVIPFYGPILMHEKIIRVIGEE